MKNNCTKHRHQSKSADHDRIRLCPDFLCQSVFQTTKNHHADELPGD